VKSLDDDYRAILRLCAVLARNASYEESPARVRAELEHLHNIPSLMGESSVMRHYDYLHRIVSSYVRWLDENRPEAAATVRADLGPVWKRMADRITPFLSAGVRELPDDE
jgi:hypothetical protein